MIRIVLIAAFMAAPSLAAAESDLETDVRAMCKRDFPTDFSTQKYCIDQAREGAIEFAEIVNRVGKDNPQASACFNDFYPDMSTATYCLNEHIKAGKKLQNWRADATGDREIAMNGCADDFPIDLSTQAYCVKEQFKAIEALNN